MVGHDGSSIVALSSPPGTSGLAVIRISGPVSKVILKTHFDREDVKRRHMHHGPFRDPASGEVLDRLNFVFLPGPGTVTGEDVLEIFPHGNMLLVDRMLKSLLKTPELRLAGPGEFTRRGFENGKIDLLQAEAVGQLIHAQTIDALRNAQRIVAGDLSAPLKELRDGLLDISVRLELDVDFSEEEADPDFASWLPRIEMIRESLAKLARSFERGKDLGRMPRVVILGAPNAGKSSLINALIEEDRLLVSDIAGTTRDYVDVPLRLPGGMIHLVDTAGLGKAVDSLDALAMERTRSQKAKADLRVWIQDGTLEVGATAKEIAGQSEGSRPDIAARGEIDGAGSDAEEFGLKVLTKSDLPGFHDRPGYLAVSNRTKSGLKEFVAELDHLVFRNRGTEEDLILTTERQFQAIEGARARVEAAHQHLKTKPAIEILAFEIREAAGFLKELLGEISTDEILQRLFSGFCIGK